MARARSRVHGRVAGGWGRAVGPLALAWAAGAPAAAVADMLDALPADRCVIARERPDIVAACYAEPTPRYGHGVFGQAPGEPGEWAALRVFLAAPSAGGAPAERRIALPEARVFEDLRPRLVDLDGDGRTEILTIEADRAEGGLLALYGLDAATERLVKRAENRPIGRRNRWLAPIGAADLDGDGVQEIAYIDRPHLAGRFRVVALDNGALRPLQGRDGLSLARSGYSNHRFGVAEIPGGVRDCGAGPEFVVANFAWTEIRVLRVRDGVVSDEGLERPPSPGGFASALSCAGED